MTCFQTHDSICVVLASAPAMTIKSPNITFGKDLVQMIVTIDRQ